MAWLGTWAHRMKIDIDNTNVDSNLSHYPLPVFLGASVGQNNEDTTPIFDEVGASYKKIAVTEDDGTTEMYVEVEQWDSTSEVAVLWVSSSTWTISSASTTTIYIYYDSTESDNTTYVGDPGSRTEVWDSDFMAVWHLRESGNGTAGEFVDSTSNNNDGQGGEGDSGKTPTQATGKIGKGNDFDGSDDYIHIGDSATLDVNQNNTMSFSVWIAPDFLSNNPNNQMIFDKEDGTPNGYRMLMHKKEDDFRFQLCVDSVVNCDTTGLSWSAGDWHMLSGHYDGSDAYIRWDGAAENNTSATGNLGNSTEDGHIGGQRLLSWGPFDGDIDELRISDNDRGADWLKFNYYCQDDNALDWYAEEDYSPATALQDIIGEGIIPFPR